MKQFSWKHVVVLLLAIPLVNQLAGYLGRSEAQRQIEEIRSPQTTKQEIKVVVTSQNSEGATQQNFDINFLSNLEAYTVERVKANTNKALASQGLEPLQSDITSEAMYVWGGSRKLAVIRLRQPGGSNSIFISGIIGDEFTRIACVSDVIESISITSGVCAEKIEEVFGSKIGA